MEIKNKIKTKPSLGTWLTLPSTAIAEMACRAGFDWVVIDLEHSTLTLETAGELIRTIDLCGKSPFVRISENDSTLIKRVMDSGAHGIIVPMVNSFEDVTKAYEAIHYPPIGKRGVGLSRAQGYGANFKEHWEWVKTKSTLLVQIEHKNALENLDEIFGSKLIDGYIIGPYDLSASLGVPGEFNHPKVLEALKIIEEMAQKYDIPKGIHLVEMDEVALKEKVKAGYKWIAYGVDFRVIDRTYRLANTVLETVTKEV